MFAAADALERLGISELAVDWGKLEILRRAKLPDDRAKLAAAYLLSGMTVREVEKKAKVHHRRVRRIRLILRGLQSPG